MKKRIKAIELMLVALCKEKEVDVDALYKSIGGGLKPPKKP